MKKQLILSSFIFLCLFEAYFSNAQNPLDEFPLGEPVLVVEDLPYYITSGDRAKGTVYLARKVEVPESQILVYAGNNTTNPNGGGGYEFVVKGYPSGIKGTEILAFLLDSEGQPFDTLSVVHENHVGYRSVVLSNDKQNVVYAGVDNPISISVAGVPSTELNPRIISGEGQIKQYGPGRYVIRTIALGELVVGMEVQGMNIRYPFRVKKVPDPVMQLGTHKGGSDIPAGAFKAQGGIIPWLWDFDYDAKCITVGFELLYLPKEGEEQNLLNKGARYIEETRKVVEMASSGDRYIFHNIRCKCPGDTGVREMGSLYFEIE